MVRPHIGSALPPSSCCSATPLLGALQAEHLHVLGTQARCGAGHIDGHVAAAHHDGATAHRLGLATVVLLLGHATQEINGHAHALGALARDAGQAAALAANRHKKRLEPLLAQLIEGNVAAHRDAQANVVAAAHHDGATAHRLGLATVVLLLGHATQEINGHAHALGALARDAGQAAALAANRHKKRLEPLLAQLIEGNVAAHRDAQANVDAHLADDVDLGFDHVLLELIAGDTVGEHAAGARVLLADDRLGAFLWHVERAGKTRGTGGYHGECRACGRTGSQSPHKTP